MAIRKATFLHEILDKMGMAVSQLQAIATACEQQSAASGENIRSLVEINVIVSDTASAMGKAANTMQRTVQPVHGADRAGRFAEQLNSPQDKKHRKGAKDSPFPHAAYRPYRSGAPMPYTFSAARRSSGGRD